MLCLAVYEHDELGTVFPYTDGECTYTVGDGLSRLETEPEDLTAGGVTA
ncbi:HTH domain-containing protein [Haloarcula nitratireducens]